MFRLHILCVNYYQNAYNLLVTTFNWGTSSPRPPTRAPLLDPGRKVGKPANGGPKLTLTLP